MPTILKIGSYRFFFYSSDRDEPYHVHVESGNFTAKIWINPIRLQYSRGFPRNEINKILEIAEENKDYFLRSWDEYFND